MRRARVGDVRLEVALGLNRLRSTDKDGSCAQAARVAAAADHWGGDCLSLAHGRRAALAASACVVGRRSRGRTRADWADRERAHAAVVSEMKRFLPSDELQFLMELSIEPVALQLGRTAPAT